MSSSGRIGPTERHEQHPVTRVTAAPDCIIFQMTQVMSRAPLRVRARFFAGLADTARLALLDTLNTPVSTEVILRDEQQEEFVTKAT